MTLLRVEDLTVTYFGTPDVRAVDGVSFDLGEDELLGLAGESGCGKSTLVSAITRLLPPSAEATAGHIWYRDRDILRLPEAELRPLRWAEIALVTQSAMNSLNPVLSVGEQLVDAMLAHAPGMGRRRALERGRELLRMVEVDPEHVRSFPHQLSGGMRQRAMIAMALALRPSLVVMDEPTTALDVVVQAQIIHKVRSLQRELHFAVIFVTHDMSLLLSVADRIAIMYAGRFVEEAPRQSLLRQPSHPYTRGLIESFPSVLRRTEHMGIPGSPPSMKAPPPGCRFHPRCAVRVTRCDRDVPTPVTVEGRHWAACHLLTEGGPAHGAGPS